MTVIHTDRFTERRKARAHARLVEHLKRSVEREELLHRAPGSDDVV